MTFATTIPTNSTLTSPNESLRLRWRVHPHAAGVRLGGDEAIDHLSPHEPAWLQLDYAPVSAQRGVLRIMLQLESHGLKSVRETTVRAERFERDGWLHLDLFDSDGRALAVSITPGGAIAFVRSIWPARLGLPGGTYDPAVIVDHAAARDAGAA